MVPILHRRCAIAGGETAVQARRRQVACAACCPACGSRGRVRAWRLGEAQGQVPARVQPCVTACAAPAGPRRATPVRQLVRRQVSVLAGADQRPSSGGEAILVGRKRRSRLLAGPCGLSLCVEFSAASVSRAAVAAAIANWNFRPRSGPRGVGVAVKTKDRPRRARPRVSCGCTLNARGLSLSQVRCPPAARAIGQLPWAGRQAIPAQVLAAARATHRDAAKASASICRLAYEVGRDALRAVQRRCRRY